MFVSMKFLLVCCVLAQVVFIFLYHVFDGVEFNDAVMFFHGYVDESANHGVESTHWGGMFVLVLYGIV